MPEIYKEGQGVLVRRCAFWALVILFVWGGQSLYTWLFNTFDFAKALVFESGKTPLEGYEVPVLEQRLNWAFFISWAFVFGACFLVFRFLNQEKSADFLIETDVELKKVTWPSWKDAWNSSLIVVVFVVVLTAFLVASDYLLDLIFRQVLHRS